VRTEELRRRKLVQWALAYLAGAWVALQLVNILAAQFGWPGGVERGITVLLAFGLPVTLVLAWYHGEKGRQRVSGPELLMLAALLVVAGATVALVRGDGEPAAAGAGAADTRPGPDAIPERSIAVLPLDNLSPAEEHAYFAGAMTEAITNALEEVPTLRVISRNSAARFAESDRTVGDFAREELGVAHVIEGSVQREGDRALITVQLIDASTEEHVWSETYDQRVVEVIDVQADIAEQVADQLAATFTDRDRRRIVAGATDDPVAYDLYLEAMKQPARTRAEFEQRMDLYRRAVRADSTFARAWTELAFNYTIGSVRYGYGAWRDSSRAALERASKFAADSVLITRLSVIRARQSGDEKRSLSLLERAVRENPSDLEAAETLSTIYYTMGDLPQAIEWQRRLIELDPLEPRHWQRGGFSYSLLSLDSLSERAWRRAIELGDEFAWRGLVGLNLLLGEYDAALAAADSLRVHDDPWADLYEGRIRLWAGERARAYDLLTAAPLEVLADAYLWAAPSVAHAHLAEGDTARAREVLRGAGRRIRAVPDPALIYLRVSTAAVLGAPDRAAQVLHEYAEAGGREARWVRSDPVFARGGDERTRPAADGRDQRGRRRPAGGHRAGRPAHGREGRRPGQPPGGAGGGRWARDGPASDVRAVAARAHARLLCHRGALPPERRRLPDREQHLPRLGQRGPDGPLLCGADRDPREPLHRHVPRDLGRGQSHPLSRPRRLRPPVRRASRASGIRASPSPSSRPRARPATRRSPCCSRWTTSSRISRRGIAPENGGGGR